MQGKIKLGYWGLRGRGQILRLLLCYTGLQWEDVVYTGPEKWFGNGDRLKLDLDFPNLPYLIRGDFKLTQSIAIAKYIAKISEKKDLLGKTPQDEARVQMLMSLLEDIYNPTYSLFFSPNYKTDKNKLFDGKIKDKMDQLQKFVGDKEFAIGYLTLADFKIAQASYYFQKLYDEQYSGYKCFQNIRKSIENLPAVKQYYSRPDAIKEPFLPSYSQLKF